MVIILASTSPYRVEQLRNFGLDFLAVPPKVDEDKLKSKKLSPAKLSAYLAYKKSQSLAVDHFEDIVIGADQLVSLSGRILGKPHTREKAIEMLKKMSGKTHQLITSLCVIHKGKVHQKTVIAKITMRKLSRDEIVAYIYRDNPLDCAGSYKLEKSGLSLVKKLSVSDPSSLVGLPLISLMKILLKTREPIPFTSQRGSRTKEK